MNLELITLIRKYFQEIEETYCFKENISYEDLISELGDVGAYGKYIMKLLKKHFYVSKNKMLLYFYTQLSSSLLKVRENLPKALDKLLSLDKIVKVNIPLEREVLGMMTAGEMKMNYLKDVDSPSNRQKYELIILTHLSKYDHQKGLITRLDLYEEIRNSWSSSYPDVLNFGLDYERIINKSIKRDFIMALKERRYSIGLGEERKTFEDESTYVLDYVPEENIIQDIIMKIVIANERITFSDLQEKFREIVEGAGNAHLIHQLMENLLDLRINGHIEFRSLGKVLIGIDEYHVSY
jgi:hypothetical protein